MKTLIFTILILLSPFTCFSSNEDYSNGNSYKVDLYWVFRSLLLILVMEFGGHFHLKDMTVDEFLQLLKEI